MSAIRGKMIPNSLGIIFKIIHFKNIIIDQSVQPREKLNELKVKEYAGYYEAGHPMPTPIVHEIENELYLCDGFTRVAGAMAAGLDRLNFIYRPKSTRHALLIEAISANSKHGQPMTAEEKRVALVRIVTISDENGFNWSQRDIAKMSGFHQSQVSRILKREFGEDDVPDEKIPSIALLEELTKEHMKQREDARIERASMKKLPKSASPTHKAVHQKIAQVIPHTNKMVMYLNDLTHHLRVTREMECGSEIAAVYEQLEEARKILTQIHGLRPHCVCRTCDGKGCEACRGRGWLTKKEATTVN